MGRIGVVLSWAAGKISGLVKHDPGGGALVQSTLYGDSGVDAPPMASDGVYVGTTQSNKKTAVLGSVDAKNASTAKQGERRTYARDDSGAPVVTHFLKQDGEASTANANGSITLQADGATVITNAGGGSITLLANGDIMATNGTSLLSLLAGAVLLTDGAGGSIGLSGGALVILAPAGGLINGAVITPTGGITSALGKDLDTHTHTYNPGPGSPTETSNSN